MPETKQTKQTKEINNANVSKNKCIKKIDKNDSYFKMEIYNKDDRCLPYNPTDYSYINNGSFFK
jgi:hypothetical protein